MKIDKLYSKVEPEKILHIICRNSDTEYSRIDVVDDKEFLQLAILKLHKGKTFKAHKHIFKEVPNNSIAQESWFVSKGKVRATLYDLDDTILSEEILEAGDCSITLYGGHNYEILEDDTQVFEYKTGPYYGQALDKEFVDD